MSFWEAHKSFINWNPCRCFLSNTSAPDYVAKATPLKEEEKICSVTIVLPSTTEAPHQDY